MIPDHAMPERPALVPPTLPFDEWPRLYAMVVEGHCMEPLVADGALCLFDKEAPVKRGHLVGAFLVGRDDNIVKCVKRLGMGIMPGIKFPCRTHPDSNCVPVVVLDYLKPTPRMIAISADKVLGIHKLVGIADAEGIVTYEGERIGLVPRETPQLVKPKRPSKLRVVEGGAP